ncbi:MAG TPA: hypothetical protein VIJ14_10555 [Rhabdochlamydiaceae bacterium]
MTIKANEFGSLEIVPNIPVEVPKPKEKILGISQEALAEMSVEVLVGLLEKCSGDIRAFENKFETNRLFTPNMVLARTMYVLYQAGNEPYLVRWETLIRSFKTACLVREESQAYNTVQNMPKPSKDDDLRVWLAYASFWLGDLREEKKTEARKRIPVASDPAVLQLMEMLKNRKIEKEPDFFEGA